VTFWKGVIIECAITEEYDAEGSDPRRIPGAITARE
jgi:hypothetical protein